MILILKYFFTALLLTISLFAEDGVIDIEKSASNLVKLAIESYADSSLSQMEKNTVDSMALGDIKVTDHLETVSTETKGIFDSPCDTAKMIQKNAKLLLRYKAYKQGGALLIETKLFDSTGKVAASNKYSVPSWAEYPFAVHQMAVDLNNFIKAPSVEWMKKFVILAKDGGTKKSDIIVADYTLTYQRTLISGGYNIFPIWGSDAQNYIYYTAYEELPTLYKYDIYTGKKTRITSSQGMLMCTDVNHDGSKILVTMAPKSLPDVFLYDTKDKTMTNISNFAGIDVNGNFLENGTKVAFVSDRLGHPTIFAKKIGSETVEQIVFNGKNSAFSAKENFLVYSARDNSDGGATQNIYHLSISDRRVRQLTKSGWNSMPKVSQTGDAVMFVKNDHGKTYLGIVRLNSLSVFLFPMNIGKIKSLAW
jgi:TolB protein